MFFATSLNWNRKYRITIYVHYMGRLIIALDIIYSRSTCDINMTNNVVVMNYAQCPAHIGIGLSSHVSVFSQRSLQVIFIRQPLAMSPPQASSSRVLSLRRTGVESMFASWWSQTLVQHQANIDLISELSPVENRRISHNASRAVLLLF